MFSKKEKEVISTLGNVGAWVAAVFSVVYLVKEGLQQGMGDEPNTTDIDPALMINGLNFEFFDDEMEFTPMSWGFGK
ncbi:hypothetical protein GH742_01295 [Legionella sp. MW5194]|uniref:hypothetical protein n=1 Tax=Legionella sp. MW5194 TaxID=2662448 RepID=UPI00193E22AC|nr:hypothetical protein [Legionella sp. MW5194]QRN02616.1 hypothetical protein GH742_01295 [Legionella sp. MW5194]